MNDKELLELAARAIGGSHLEVYDIGGRHGVSGYFPEHPNSLTYWNPLADDGDALRLAAELKMMVCLHTTPAHVYADMPSRDVVTDACYRRAIVSAAAEIGRKM